MNNKHKYYLLNKGIINKFPGPSIFRELYIIINKAAQECTAASLFVSGLTMSVYKLNSATKPFIFYLSCIWEAFFRRLRFQFSERRLTMLLISVFLQNLDAVTTWLSAGEPNCESSGEELKATKVKVQARTVTDPRNNIQTRTGRTKHLKIWQRHTRGFNLR